MTQSAHLWDRLNAEAALLQHRGRDDPYSDRVICATDTVARMRQRVHALRYYPARRRDRARPDRHPGLDGGASELEDAGRQPGQGTERRRRAGLRRHGGGRDRHRRAFPGAASASARCRISRPRARGSIRSTISSRAASARRPHPRPLAWVEGHDLLKNDTVWVPADAVSLDSDDASGRRSRYWQSSDGLASGNILIEAVVHGLCERIERDAGVLWLFRSDKDVFDCCLDPAALHDEAVDGLAEQIDRSGFQLRLFDITSDVGVPVMLRHHRAKARRLRAALEALRHFERHGLPPLAVARRHPRDHRGGAEPRDQHHRRARRLRPQPLRTQLKADLTAYLRADPLQPDRRCRGDAARSGRQPPLHPRRGFARSVSAR